MYIFRLAIPAFLICLSYAALAQKNINSFTFSGRVTDSTGKPLQAASIYIPDIRKGAITDSAGDYSIQKIPAGNFLVSVNFTGYQTIIRNIEFQSDIQMNFRLKIAITEEKEIVITSSLQATTIKRNPIPIVNISNEFLARNVNANIVNAIAGVPGISAVSTGPNVSKPFIRGLGYNRVLTLFDGIRQEGQQWGDEHGIEIDENTVDHVEIIKGPASLLYGSDALAGVINFIPPKEPTSGKGSGGVSLLYQTNNNLLESSAHAESHNGDLSWGLIGSHKMAADYQNKIDGRVYNTGFRQSSLFFQSALHKKWGYSRMGISFLSDLQEIPDGKRDSATRKFEKEIADNQFEIVPENELHSYKISHQHQQIQHFRAYNITSHALGAGRLETQLGFQKNIRKEFEDPASNEPGLNLNLNTLTYGFKYFLPEINKLSVTAGVNGMYQVNHSGNGNEFLIPDYHQFDFGPFIYAKISREASEFTAGIRYDVRRFRNDELYVRKTGDGEIPVSGSDTIQATKLFSDYKNTFGGLSGSMGFSHRFNRHWNLKINMAQGYRAPNISEISSNGIHSGAKIYQLGNAGFKPEYSFQQDANVTYHSEHITIDASIFNNNIRNYIFNQKLLTASGADSVIVPGVETFQYTSSRAQLHGGELLIDLHPHPLDWLHFENTVSMVFAKNTGNSHQQISDDEKYLPLIPPVHLRSELRGNFQNWKSLRNIYFQIQSDLFASQNRVFSRNNTETPTPGYQLFNIGAGAAIKGKSGNTIAAISLMVNNLFDRSYQSNMSRLKYFEDFPEDPRGHRGIYEMGRNISIKLNFPFEF